MSLPPRHPPYGIVAVLFAILVSGCLDAEAPCDEPLPSEMPCTTFEAMFRPERGPVVVPSVVPAPWGVRVVVDPHFDPYVGSSAPVPGGRMAWSVWVFRWWDGDHLGTIGRVPDPPRPPPIGGTCRWYSPI